VNGPDPGEPAPLAATLAADLEDVLVSASEELPAVTSEGDTTSMTWAVGGLPFAVLSGVRVEFRLDPLVARAALRTSDTAASARGPEWVAFEPAELDDAAIDRVEAWFLSAHRRVAGAGGRDSPGS
jgi:hypothetical protein